ncbi:hypothetical protein BGX20_009444 [Mortierella sp. AD010]|nr:hypothetical protein BGX20_009444 [Mortierella sp. AD010]
MGTREIYKSTKQSGYEVCMGPGVYFYMMSSATETPLRDAAPFSSLRNLKSSDLLANDDSQHGQQNSADAFQDPLSSSSSSSPLPVTSFSRRAVTVSAGSSPMPGLPGRRTSSSTSSTRSSILSKDSIFSAPASARRGSSTSESATGPGRERSASNASKESEEPTPKDVTLMAQGTQAYSLLKRIQEHPIELADIIRMLVTKKAILILPTCAASTDEPSPSRPTYEDHVIIPESNHGESLFVTLSGIRGVLRPSSSSISILGLATGHDFGTVASDAAGPTKRSFFDNISKSEGSEGAVAAADANKELKLVNSSKRPVTIFVESVGSIHALLVDGIIPKPEGDAAPTPIVPLASGIATLKDRSVARRTASSSSSVRSMNMNDDKDATPLPKLPKIAADLPLEWDNALRDLESFVAKLKKSPLSNIDRYANEFQRKYDDVRRRFVVYGNASGLRHRWVDHDLDEVQQWVEAWLCREMYATIFPHSSQGINGRDYLQDEQLQAKIAALNFMDLTLEHLGFVLEHPEDVAHIAQVVREGGVEMQKLALVKSPSDKMNVILSSHRIVIDALNREPAVQELLVGMEESQEASASGDNAVESESAKSPVTADSSSKRISLSKIPMDGVIPRLDASGSAVSAISPTIPMDQGYDKPSQDRDEKETSIDGVKEATTVQDEVPPSENKVTEATEEKKDIEKEDSATAAVKPENIELPTSPAPETTPVPSLVVSVSDATTSTAVTETTATAVPSSASSRKQYSADVLLPLLIFSVVKSNPPMLISNLSYIQRFKVQDHLTGELAYCLTNMMAVVSFLETLDPQALGLSNDVRVFSRDQSKLNFQEGLDQTKLLGQKVSQEIVVAAEEGIKVISDVVQDGYSKFLGRFLNNNDGSGSSSLSFGINNNTKPSGIMTRNTRALSAASSLAATAAASLAADEKRRAALAAYTGGADEKNKGLTGQASSAGVTNSDGVDKTSPHESAMEHAARSRLIDYIRTSQGPQLQFMACTDSGDLRLSDVKGLLDDYQRIGKILNEIKQLI